MLFSTDTKCQPKEAHRNDHFRCDNISKNNLEQEVVMSAIQNFIYSIHDLLYSIQKTLYSIQDFMYTYSDVV